MGTTVTLPGADGMVPRWDKSIPRKGWSCVDVEDHEEPIFTCELCGYPAVRYVHVMGHASYHGELRVGCVCAGRLEQNYAAAKGRERVARNLSARCLRWCDPDRWRISEKGNLWRKFHGTRVVIFPNPWKPGEWKAVIGSQVGTLSYATTNDAMRGVFRRISRTKPITSR